MTRNLQKQRNKLACFALVMAGCASTPRAGVVDQAVFENVTVADAREAARAVVEQIADPRSGVRVTNDGSVLTDGRIGDCGVDVACGSYPDLQGTGATTGTPWTTIEIRFREDGMDTAVEIDIEYETRYCGRDEIDCAPQPLSSNGGLERRILDGIHARLEAGR